MARIRIRYAKRGPLRFTSHRDFARAFERAIRRSGIPIAYSQGFTPHPKISYASAAPTGVASEAEYLEIGLRAPMEPEAVRAALDQALSRGLDVVEAAAVPAGAPSLADLIDASRWQVELPGVAEPDLRRAVATFLAATEVPVERPAQSERRRLDARSAVVSIDVLGVSGGEGRAAAPAPAGDSGQLSGSGAVASAGEGPRCAILVSVVRQVIPSVRPDDVLAGLQVVADLVPPNPPRVTRLAQGRLTPEGEIVDPLSATVRWRGSAG